MITACLLWTVHCALSRGGTVPVLHSAGAGSREQGAGSRSTFIIDSFTRDLFIIDLFTIDSFTCDLFTIDSFTIDSFTCDSISVDSFTVDSFTIDSFTSYPATFSAWNGAGTLPVLHLR